MLLVVLGLAVGLAAIATGALVWAYEVWRSP
jgi:hypothetical protein